MNLKEVLQQNDVQTGLLSNLFKGEKDILSKVMPKIEKLEERNNNFQCKITIEKDNSNFENQLHQSKDGKFYLLESRLFSENGEMKGALLEIFDNNGEKINNFVDDVWAFAAWEKSE